ncbi:MAG: KamA family radical SAM protein [Lentisphaeria bacterium]
MEQIVSRALIDNDEEPPLYECSQSKATKVYHFYRKPVLAEADSNPKTMAFREIFFPSVSNREWNDYHWQLKNRITTLEEIKKYLVLTEEERIALEDNGSRFPFAITPYYLSLLDLKDPDSELRKTVIPTINESMKSKGEAEDPLNEDGTSPVPGICHRYPDRVLFLTTSFCSTYCRYCTRSRMVGGHSQKMENQWANAIDYIRRTPQIRDVIISGGDPLTLCDNKIDYLLREITSIDHVEMVRIGSKVPMVLPQRITPSLLRIFKRYKPLFLSIHCTHPDELTKESAKACNDIADAGVVMGSQTVLLKGVNDKVETLTALFQGLLKVRVKPYYLFQCDPIIGSSHFRTTIEKGKSLIFGIRGFTSGYAVPQYVIDTPGGGGKVPILPKYEMKQDEEYLYLKNYENKIFRYPDEKK